MDCPKNASSMYHESEQIVEFPKWNYEKDSTAAITKDFGHGFYMCETPEYPIRV